MHFCLHILDASIIFIFFKDYTQVCSLRKGFRLVSEKSYTVDNIPDENKCAKLCDSRKECLAMNFFKKKKKWVFLITPKDFAIGVKMWLSSHIWS